MFNNSKTLVAIKSEHAISGSGDDQIVVEELWNVKKLNKHSFSIPGMGVPSLAS